MKHNFGMRKVCAVEEHTGVAVVSLARPPVNALDLPMIEELESTFARVANATPRIGVVLTGAGNTFSAGVDTKAFASYGREERHRVVLAITRMTGPFFLCLARWLLRLMDMRWEAALF